MWWARADGFTTLNTSINSACLSDQKMLEQTWVTAIGPVINAQDHTSRGSQAMSTGHHIFYTQTASDLNWNRRRGRSLTAAVDVELVLYPHIREVADEGIEA